jgi:hypothetical protein
LPSHRSFPQNVLTFPEVSVGREATCTCIWNGKKGTVKALIEPPDLILRGELRHRIPIARMQAVKAERDQLRFVIEGEVVSLLLGSEAAARWADTLLRPPPSLAQKLGISADKTVWMIGTIDEANLKAALTEAKSVSRRDGELILARIDTPTDLQSALARAADQLRAGVPIWFIYRKGSGHPLNENLVRSIALETGIVDTKVAAVSTEFSALRFVKRKS